MLVELDYAAEVLGVHSSTLRYGKYEEFLVSSYGSEYTYIDIDKTRKKMEEEEQTMSDRSRIVMFIGFLKEELGVRPRAIESKSGVNARQVSTHHRLGHKKLLAILGSYKQEAKLFDRWWNNEKIIYNGEVIC